MGQNGTFHFTVNRDLLDNSQRYSLSVNFADWSTRRQDEYFTQFTALFVH